MEIALVLLWKHGHWGRPIWGLYLFGFYALILMIVGIDKLLDWWAKRRRHR